MNLKELKTLIDTGKILIVFSGKVQQKDTYYQEPFGEIPECECQEMLQWDDIECMPDDTEIIYLTCYDEHKQPFYYERQAGFYYGSKNNKQNRS